jgi:hypothetical protein
VKFRSYAPGSSRSKRRLRDLGPFVKTPDFFTAKAHRASAVASDGCELMSFAG